MAEITGPAGGWCGLLHRSVRSRCEGDGPAGTPPLKTLSSRTPEWSPEPAGRRGRPLAGCGCGRRADPTNYPRPAGPAGRSPLAGRKPGANGPGWPGRRPQRQIPRVRAGHWRSCPRRPARTGRGPPPEPDAVGDRRGVAALLVAADHAHAVGRELVGPEHVLDALPVVRLQHHEADVVVGVGELRPLRSDEQPGDRPHPVRFLAVPVPGDEDDVAGVAAAALAAVDAVRGRDQQVLARAGHDAGGAEVVAARAGPSTSAGSPPTWTAPASPRRSTAPASAPPYPKRLSARLGRRARAGPQRPQGDPPCQVPS
jgi:hypothetical protein